MGAGHPSRPQLRQLASLIQNRGMDRLKLPINEQQTRCLRCPQEPLAFPGYRIGRHDRPYRRGILYRDPSGQGERPEYLPSGQRADGPEAGDEDRRGHGGKAEPDAVRMGQLLLSRSGQASLPGHGHAHDTAAATVALSQAQGDQRDVGALSRCEVMGCLWCRSPCGDDQGPAMGEGMILSESRRRENRTSGLMSGGEETYPWFGTGVLA